MQIILNTLYCYSYSNVCIVDYTRIILSYKPTTDWNFYVTFCQRHDICFDKIANDLPRLLARDGPLFSTDNINHLQS